jgi:hypothetical protein
MEVIMARDAIVQISREHDGRLTIKTKGHPDLSFNPQRASLLNRDYAQYFGWANRFMNGAAKKADSTSGKTSPAEKFDTLKKLVEFYEAGGDDWNMKAGPRNTGPDIGLLVKALMALHGLADVDAANRLLDKTAEKHGVERDAVVAKLWGAKDVVAWVAAHRLEARTFEINSDDFLAEMDDETDES